MMKRFAVLIAMMFLFIPALAWGQGVEIDEPTPPPSQEMQENACDCCQKCKAAQSDVKTQEEEGATEKDGCGDCCSRCSEPVKTMPETHSPDVIDNAPPDIIEKSK